ncbi:hypothetical protein GCM10010170_078710 [Dactylosporangium salmoneum]|uniref:Uncharacterized protein n=1 Tax=Dactylosporangium salmoneum TaxID=53361 RepID=A0ABP5UAX3_9ACTN
MPRSYGIAQIEVVKSGAELRQCVPYRARHWITWGVVNAAGEMAADSQQPSRPYRLIRGMRHGRGQLPELPGKPVQPFPGCLVKLGDTGPQRLEPVQG